jgi:hypothetical protein
MRATLSVPSQNIWERWELRPEFTTLNRVPFGCAGTSRTHGLPHSSGLLVSPPARIGSSMGRLMQQRRCGACGLQPVLDGSLYGE